MIFLCACTTKVKSAESPKALPPWLEKQIKMMESAVAPGYSIDELNLGKKKYYRVPAPSCCDIYDTLYDAEGIIICHPSGGITGHGDNKCGTLLEGKIESKVIWSKEKSAQ